MNTPNISNLGAIYKHNSFVDITPAPEGENEQEAAVEFLSGLFESDDIICLTFIHATKTTFDGNAVVENHFLPLRNVTSTTGLKRLKERNHDGWNVYVSMAAFKSNTTQRTHENISAVRHVFIDIDKNGKESLNRLKSAVEAKSIPLPAFIVESSPNKYQAIWNIEGVTIEQGKQLNISLISAFDSDPACKDVARVLRIPGYCNLKPEYSKPVCTIVERGSTDINGFSDFKLEIPKNGNGNGFKSPYVLPDEIREGDPGRNRELHLFASSLRAKGMGDSEILAALQVTNTTRCKPRLPEGVLQTITRSVMNYPAGTTWTNAPKPDIATTELERTEGGNAKRLLLAHGQDLRYCPKRSSWYVWDGVRWVQDPEGLTVVARMKSVLAKMREDSRATLDRLKEQVETLQTSFTKDGQLRANAVLSEKDYAALNDHSKAEKDLKWATKSDGRNQVYNAVTMAKSEEGVTIEPCAFDANLYLLNVQNGSIDLRTGVLGPHRREDFCSRVAPVAYDPNAGHPMFLETLNLMFEEHPELIPYLQDFFGLALSGIVTPDILVLLGNGRNGKSTIVQVVRGVLGSVYKGGYAVQAAASTFVESRYENSGGTRSDIRALDGARLVSSPEYTRRQKLDMGVLKALTGGDDKAARDLHERQTEFTPQGSIVLLTNEQPIVPDQTCGTWARIKEVPSNANIPEKLTSAGRQLINDYHKVILESEASGVLNWLLAGALRCFEREASGQTLLTPPAIVLDATEAYRKQQSRPLRFLDEKVRLIEGATVETTKLYQQYVEWLAEQGERYPESQKSFAQAIKQGYQELKEGQHARTRRAVWVGIELVEDGFAQNAIL